MVRSHLDGDKPIYLQIKETIEDDIIDGLLKEDEVVPSTTELVDFYRINPATAQKGISLLTDETILYKKRGVGMFVSSGARQKLVIKRKKLFIQKQITSLVSEARRLGISDQELVEIVINQASDTNEEGPGNE